MQNTLLDVQAQLEALQEKVKSLIQCVEARGPCTLTNQNSALKQGMVMVRRPGLFLGLGLIQVGPMGKLEWVILMGLGPHSRTKKRLSW